MNVEEQNFAELLAPLSDRQVFEFCIEATRRMRRKGDPASTLRTDPQTLQNELLPILLEHHGRKGAAPQVAPLQTYLNRDWALPVLAFFAWLERTGLATKFGGTVQEPVHQMRLLPAGIRFFDGADDAHPLVPGWAQRLEQRCPKLSKENLALLVDSHSCFEHGLFRAAVTLLGVSFEAVVEEVLEALVATKDATYPKKVNAATRLEHARKGIQQREKRPEPLRKAILACDFADSLRTRRNDAAHVKFGFAFDSRDEVEDLLVGGARHLPSLVAFL